MGLELHYNVYGCFREPLADIELAKYAVDRGFEGVWIGDHFLPWIDSRPYTHHILPWFGTLMSEVPDVPVGTSVTCPMIRYRPPVLAQALATLDNMFPGRMNLGVGTGEAVSEAHFVDGEWPDWWTRAEMMIETIEVMRKLWDADEYISYDGDHFEYDAIKLYTNAKEEIDIHWAAWGHTSSQYAGEYADHLITSAGADRIENHILPNYEEGLAEVGRDLSEVDVTTEAAFNFGDPDQLVRDIRERGEHIPHGHRDNSDPREIQAAGDEELAGMSDEEVREANNISDDPAEFVEALERLEDAGVTRVLVGSNAGDPRETIDVFEETVIPKFE